MTPEERATAAKLIFDAARALEDGAISPEEGRWLCKAGVERLYRLRPKAKRWVGRTAIDGASLVLRQLASDLEELPDEGTRSTAHPRELPGHRTRLLSVVGDKIPSKEHGRDPRASELARGPAGQKLNMPIQTIQDDAGRTLYRWGDTGKLYRTRKSALKQGRAIKARQEADRIYKAQQERRQLYRQAKRMDLEELEAFWQLRQELKAEKESSRELDYTADDQLTDRGIQRLLKKARRQLRLEQGMKVSPELPEELEEATTSKSGIRTKAKRGRPIKSIYRRDDLTAREAQKRRRKGAVVNATIPRPKPPCKGLDEEKCEVCGEFVREV